RLRHLPRDSRPGPSAGCAESLGNRDGAMTRRHDIDVLRTLAFGLLILYHVGMVYVADWGFHVKSSHQSQLLQWPMIFVNRWRMSLLFLLSGLTVGLVVASMRPG